MFPALEAQALQNPLAPCFGVVVIGRNEGDRLVRCLESIIPQIPPLAPGFSDSQAQLQPPHVLDYPDSHLPIIYVDSGSQDDSIAQSQRRGVRVVALGSQPPFTAARARNAGWQELVSCWPRVEYVQFVDGDCELDPQWLQRGLGWLTQDETIAVVCGRRRERFPEASPYNRLADLEWNTPVGEALACGGDALIRVAALQAVGGYDARLICGEEPEMCLRMRRLGWKIWRIDAEMTLHDAAMLYFGQWWRRSIRGGWFVAEGYHRYGKAPERYMVREHLSGWLWGAIVPVGILGLIITMGNWGLLGLLVYGLLGWRIYQFRRRQGDRPSHARLYSFYCVISKVAQAMGQGQYWLTHWRGQQGTLIEYK
jgi:glycosyltransferase involved in cell wall biosynthesis